MCTHSNHFSKHNQGHCGCGCSNQLFLSKKKRLEMLNNYLISLQEREEDVKEAIKELENQ